MNALTSKHNGCHDASETRAHILQQNVGYRDRHGIQYSGFVLMSTILVLESFALVNIRVTR